MASIGIFGDSFAANPHLEYNPKTEGFLREVYRVCKKPFSSESVSRLASVWGERYVGWHRHIDADVYGQSGSDLYFSYNQFIKNHQKHEKCVFIITSSFRYSTKSDFWIHCATYDDAVENIEFSTNYTNKQYFKSLANFFKDVYYKDEERVDLINRAMLDSIRLIRPDTIFINAFPDLKRVYDLELEAWNMTHEESQDYTKYFDLRHCHMTNNNNKILADFILDNLDKRGILDLSSVEWKAPSVEERSYYLPNTADLFTRLT